MLLTNRPEMGSLKTTLLGLLLAGGTTDTDVLLSFTFFFFLVCLFLRISTTLPYVCLPHVMLEQVLTSKFQQRGILNVTTKQDILLKCVHQTLRQQFGEERHV